MGVHRLENVTFQCSSDVPVWQKSAIVSLCVKDVLIHSFSLLQQNPGGRSLLTYGLSFLTGPVGRRSMKSHKDAP